VFGHESLTPAPVSIGVADNTIGSNTNYGAFIFVVSATSGQVHKFISHDEYTDTNTGPPPEE